jgi:hypothetical protein
MISNGVEGLAVVSSLPEQGYGYPPVNNDGPPWEKETYPPPVPGHQCHN